MRDLLIKERTMKRHWLICKIMLCALGVTELCLLGVVLYAFATQP